MQSSGRLFAILLILCACSLLAAHDTTAKYLATHGYDPLQIVWARYLGHFLVAVVLLLRRRLLPWHSTRLKLQMGRTVMLVAASYCMVVSLQVVPLADAATIIMTNPLFVTVLAIPLLGERVGWRRMVALAIGFSGTILVLRPGFASFEPQILFTLVAAILTAFYLISTRIVAGSDPYEVSFLWASLGGALGLTPLIPFVWTPPASLLDGLLLLSLSFWAGIGHFLIIVAHRHAPAPVLAPFSYCQLLVTIILGILFFGRGPDLFTLLGAALLVGSGLYVWQREWRLARSRASVVTRLPDGPARHRARPAMSGPTRRGLLRAGAALALGAPFAGTVRADQVTDLLGQVLADGRMAPGMPARIPSGVIGFANWRYVSPGSFSWQRADPANTTAFGASFDRIEVPFGIRLLVHVPDRLGPVDLPTPGLAVSGASLNTVMLDQGVYRGWGYALPEGAELSQLRYFESTNGLDWTPRPWRGQRLDIDLPRRGWVRGHVFRSGDPADPMPYKHVEEGVMAPDVVRGLLESRAGRIDPQSFRGDAGKVYGLFGAQSADGLAWTPNELPLAVQHSDTQTIGSYDAERRRYALYTRTWDTPVTDGADMLAWSHGWIAAGRRAIGRTESADFADFPLSQTVLAPGPELRPSEQYYYNCRTTLPDAPDQHVMFPGVYDLATDIIEAHGAVSADGVAWARTPGGPLIGARPDQPWERGTILAHPNLIRTRDGDVVLPYTGFDVPHKFPRDHWRFRLGFARWSRGRVMGLAADEAGGFTTPFFHAPGDRILIDAQTDATGYLRFELASLKEGRLLLEKDSIPFSGDALAHEIGWSGRNRLPIEPDEPIKLTVSLYRARLYAIRFARHG